MHFPLSRFINRILCGDAHKILRQMPDKCVDYGVTVRYSDL